MGDGLASALTQNAGCFTNAPDVKMQYLKYRNGEYYK